MRSDLGLHQNRRPRRVDSRPLIAIPLMKSEEIMWWFPAPKPLFLMILVVVVSSNAWARDCIGKRTLLRNESPSMIRDFHYELPNGIKTHNLLTEEFWPSNQPQSIEIRERRSVPAKFFA